MIVCVAGNPAIDKLFEVEEVTVGAIHRPRELVALPGGKGIHVAQVATALGGEAVATGILAGHAGRWLAEALSGEGVSHRFAWGRGETRSCLSVADRATGSLTEFYEDGVPAQTEEWTALTEIVHGLLPAASWLAMAGSLPAAEELGGYAQLVSIAREAGVSSAVDSRGPDLARALRSGPDLVKINAAEAEELLRRPVGDISHARDAAAQLRARAGGDGHAAVITLGERGMVLVEPGGEAWHGSVSARGDYPVGSGDAFLAGLLTALDRGESWPQAASSALGAAAANAEIPGAGRLHAPRARQLAEQAELRVI